MISIIIVGYNSYKYLPDCLESIFNSEFTNFEVYFIDNNSQDESINYIKENWEKVKVIELKENVGFAKANNIGAELAIKNGCDHIFLLNPDTIIDPKCLTLLSESADSNTIVQPLVLLHENNKKTNQVNTSGNVLHYLGVSYVGNYRKNYRDIKFDKDIAIASGAAIYIPTLIIKKIGLFDENLFMYHEDTDFSWRARCAGYNIQLNSEAIIWHKYSFSRNKQKMFFTERNRLIFLSKNFDIKYKLLISPIFILNELLVIAYATLDGWLLLKLKSYISFFSLKPKINKGNKINCKQSIKNIKQFLGYEMSFSEFNNPLFKPYNFILKIYWKIISPLI